MALFLLFFSFFPAFPSVRGETQLQNDEECKSGIHCKGREQSLPSCPAGFFCPRGSSPPVPCPPGTFRSEGTALPWHRCQPCPVGFFSARPGQQSCLPCGSEAAQPEEGQQSCVCLGTGQVFQPRDALCTCPPGFRRSGRDGRLCVQQTFAACRDSASRNQEGKCLTKRGWSRYCSEKVCAVPGDYRGYDKVLGLCVCHTDSLEGICDSRCRREQKNTLQISCAQRKAQLSITHRNGSKTAVPLEDLRTLLPRPNFSLEDVCASGQGKHSHPAHVVEMSGKGFLGVYDPDPQAIHDFITLNEASSLHKRSPPSAAAPEHPGHEECREQRLRPQNSSSQTPFLGILNPITCISGNITLVFIVSREHFPVYDVNNLYNTNAEFDWGDFRSLGEGLRESSQKFLLFPFQFQAPGAYVLRLSSHRHKRMYVRVMPPGAQCYEQGPFLPCSPRFAVQVGLAPRAELLLRPDRAAIAGASAGLLLLLAACLALPLLCPGLGWALRGSPSPTFRRQQLQYSLDGYSSKIPTVFPVRKCHPSLQHELGTGCVLRRAEPWEPEGHIDLEAFDTKVFFELLLRQSHSVTTTLGHFKEEVKILYHRVMNEISSLKKLWIKALSIPGKGEDGESCRKAKQQVLFPGSPQAFENSESPGFYGLGGVSGNAREVIPQKLIPLLRSAVQVLEEHRKNGLSPATPGTKVLKQAEHLMASRTALLNPQLPPLPGDEIKCEKSSFLLGLLKEVSDELRSHALAAGLGLSQRLEKTGMTAEGAEDASGARERELAAVDPAALTPREFVLFQYGLSILRLLTSHSRAPEVSLGIASSLPPSPAPSNAFSNSYFYQHSKKKLFILRDCLGSVGGFLLLLVRCWAHVTAGELGHDTKPAVLGLFHQALEACLSEMFSLRLQLSAAPPGDKSQRINQVLLKEEPFSREEMNLISQLFEVRVKSLTDLEAFEKNLLLRVKSEEPLNAKWLGKKKEHFLHSSSGRRARSGEEPVPSSGPSELEDKVDALTEELVHIFEDELQFLRSKGNEDLLSYYLEITSLEKESLVQQINALEEEIAQGRKL